MILSELLLSHMLFLLAILALPPPTPYHLLFVAPRCIHLDAKLLVQRLLGTGRSRCQPTLWLGAGFMACAGNAVRGWVAGAVGFIGLT